MTSKNTNLAPSWPVTLTGHSSLKKKEEIKNYFLQVCQLEDQLFSLLKNDESFYERPENLRHPLIFYFAHTHTFYINKLVLSKSLSTRINPRFESIFAIGVDEMSWDDLNERNYDWPEISEVREYRKLVQKTVLDLIDNMEMSLPIAWDSPFWVVMMGIEHHNIHIETSSVLLRQLSLDFIAPSDLWKTKKENSKAPVNQLIEVKVGEVSLPRDKNSEYYGWDNEYGVQKENVPSFKATQYLVSNSEYLEFLNDGGAADKENWTSEGWDWAVYSHYKMPHFWRQKNEKYHLRTMQEEIPLPMSWPAEVNYYEAKAFVNWKSKTSGKKYRLPLESEWRRLRDYCDVGDVGDWNREPRGNLNLQYATHSLPVDQFQFKHNFYDVIGNSWQWSESTINAFNEFRVHPVYDDFSVPTFDGKHNLMFGGSWASCGNEMTKYARYAFRKHFFQHAGFRYVESSMTTNTFDNVYEEDFQVAQYLEFHYGDECFETPNFPKACIDYCRPFYKSGKSKKRALDIGCAVGRSTFELATDFDHVTGIDFTARFIAKAQEMSSKGFVEYLRLEEGHLSEKMTRKLEEFSNTSVAKKCEFYQADACNMPEKFKNYDFVFAGNLIDRLYSPQKFLKSIHELINSEGILVLTSPYTWLEEFTPVDEWPGDIKDRAGNRTTLDGLKEWMSEHFDLIDSGTQIPFVIRETKRKHQHTLSEVTIWKKKL
jgi:5-histidylcysteine sulfoxide synthase/putative 4-mercaptohistidine N1-methyltranferase